MNRLVSATALLALLAPVAAYGADVYSSGSTKDPITGVLGATTTWTGFEIGAQAGYGFEGTRRDIVPTFTPSSNISIPGGDTLNKDHAYALDTLAAPIPGGIVGGVYVGYLYQIPNSHFVIGAEADFNASGISNKANTELTVGKGPDAFPLTATASQSLEWYGTAVGKAGVAVGPVLVYATGGLAYGEINDSLSGSFSKTVTVNSVDTTTTYSSGIRNRGIDVGYTVGGGVEFKPSNAWSFGVDYKYLDFGAKSISATAYDPKTPTTAIGHATTTNFDGDFHTVMARATYHFGNN